MSEDNRKMSFYANLRHKIRMLRVQSKGYLSHAPHFEKYGLCLSIWNTERLIGDLAVRGQKRYFNKTDLTNLDVAIETLRDQWSDFYTFGYFHYKNQKKQLTDRDAIKRFACINIMVDEIGAMVGSLVNEAKAKEIAKAESAKR